MPDSETQRKLRWRRIQTLFDAVVDVDPAERDEWLEQQCGDDGDLLAELRALLECDERSTQFLQRTTRKTLKLSRNRTPLNLVQQTSLTCARRSSH